MIAIDINSLMLSLSYLKHCSAIHSDMIKPRVVTPLVGVADSNTVIYVGTDTADCVDDPSKAIVRYIGA